MDVCVENVFPAVAMPFNPFHEDAREEKGRGADAPRCKTIPNIVHVDVDAFFASVEQVLEPEAAREAGAGGARRGGVGELRSESARREDGDDVS